MRYWIGPWVWEATGGWIPPEGAIHSLDLRSRVQSSTAQTPLGYGLFATPNAADLGSGYVNLGINPLRSLTSAEKRAWRERLMLQGPVIASNLLEAVWETITVQSDPTGRERRLPVIPTKQGNLELWLGGQRAISKKLLPSSPEWLPIRASIREQYRNLRQASLDGKLPPGHYRKALGYWVRKYKVAYRQLQPDDLPDESPLEPTTTYSDVFNRANSTTIGTPWVELVGQWTINSQTLRSVSGSGANEDSLILYGDPLSGDDHYCQWLLDEIDTGTTSTAGIVARAASVSVNSDRYLANLTWADASASRVNRVYKYVGGVRTQITSASHSLPRGGARIARLTVNGSSIRFDVSTLPELSVTDSDVIGGLYVGAMQRAFVGSTSFRAIHDEFETSDVEPIVEGPPPSNFFLAF